MSAKLFVQSTRPASPLFAECVKDRSQMFASLTGSNGVAATSAKMVLYLGVLPIDIGNSSELQREQFEAYDFGMMSYDVSEIKDQRTCSRVCQDSAVAPSQNPRNHGPKLA